jgi:hypothetical protein
MLLLAVLAMLVSAMAVQARDGDEASVFTDVMGRFRPGKPTAAMSYDVSYALLHIRLKRVAGATLKATEGFWLSRPSNEWIPACLIDFQVASPRTGEGGVKLFKRTLSVMTMPDLRIITYAKQNDEVIKPFFGKVRVMKYRELYDFESGDLIYRRHDLTTGAVETNLANRADLARQSTEVADVLQSLYASYHDHSILERVGANKVHFNVEGAVRTFVLRMTKGSLTVPVLSRRVVALYAEVRPEERSATLNESFSMWCVPFRDFARETQDPELKKLAGMSLEYSMLPLSGEYALFMGSLQCTLTNICAQFR